MNHLIKIKSQLKREDHLIYINIIENDNFYYIERTFAVYICKKK